MASNPARDNITVPARGFARRHCRHVALAAALLASPVAVFALGLGQPAVHSYLGAPFDVTIAVFGAAGSDLRADLVSPGSSVGATTVRARLERDAGGTPFVHLTTSAGLSEPVVALSVRISGDGQQSIREYTVLLDPQRPAEVQAPAAQRREPVRRAATPRASSAVLPSFERTVSAPAGGVTYGPVRPGETLYAITRALAAEHRIDRAQLASAIVASNPRAFPGGDARRMLAGAVLAVPLEPGDLSTAPSLAASRPSAAAAPPSPQKRAQISDLSERIAATRRAIAEERTRRNELQRRLDRATEQIATLLDRQSALDQRQVELVGAVEALTAKGAVNPAERQAAVATASTAPAVDGAASDGPGALAPAAALPATGTPRPAVPPAPLPSASALLSDVTGMLGPYAVPGIALVLVLLALALGYRFWRNRQHGDSADRNLDDAAARERIAQVRDEFNQTLGSRQNVVVALDSAREERRAAAG